MSVASSRPTNFVSTGTSAFNCWQIGTEQYACDTDTATSMNRGDSGTVQTQTYLKNFGFSIPSCNLNNIAVALYCSDGAAGTQIYVDLHTAATMSHTKFGYSGNYAPGIEAEWLRATIWYSTTAGTAPTFAQINSSAFCIRPWCPKLKQAQKIFDARVVINYTETELTETTKRLSNKLVFPEYRYRLSNKICLDQTKVVPRLANRIYKDKEWVARSSNILKGWKETSERLRHKIPFNVSYATNLIYPPGRDVSKVGTWYKCTGDNQFGTGTDSTDLYSYVDEGVIYNPRDQIFTKYSYSGFSTGWQVIFDASNITDGHLVQPSWRRMKIRMTANQRSNTYYLKMRGVLIKSGVTYLSTPAYSISRALTQVAFDFYNPPWGDDWGITQNYQFGVRIAEIQSGYNELININNVFMQFFTPDTTVYPSGTNYTSTAHYSVTCNAFRITNTNIYSGVWNPSAYPYSTAFWSNSGIVVDTRWRSVYSTASDKDSCYMVSSAKLGNYFAGIGYSGDRYHFTERDWAPRIRARMCLTNAGWVRVQGGTYKAGIDLWRLSTSQIVNTTGFTDYVFSWDSGCPGSDTAWGQPDINNLSFGIKVSTTDSGSHTLKLSSLWWELRRSIEAKRVSNVIDLDKLNNTQRLSNKISFVAYGTPPWWDDNYFRRSKIKLSSAGQTHSALPIGYTVDFNFLTGYEQGPIPINDLSIGTWVNNQPVRYKRNGKTYVYSAYLGRSLTGGDQKIYAVKYNVDDTSIITGDSSNPTVGNWSTPFPIAYGGPWTDDHSIPTTYISNDGIMHIFYGAHGNETYPLRHIYSLAAVDVNLRNWSAIYNMTTSGPSTNTTPTYFTYPAPCEDSQGNLYLFGRGGQTQQMRQPPYTFAGYGYFKHSSGRPWTEWHRWNLIADYSRENIDFYTGWNYPTIYSRDMSYLNGRFHLTLNWWNRYLQSGDQFGRAVSYHWSNDAVNWYNINGDLCGIADSAFYATSCVRGSRILYYGTTVGSTIYYPPDRVFVSGNDNPYDTAEWSWGAALSSTNNCPGYYISSKVVTDYRGYPWFTVAEWNSIYGEEKEIWAGYWNGVSWKRVNLSTIWGVSLLKKTIMHDIDLIVEDSDIYFLGKVYPPNISSEKMFAAETFEWHTDNWGEHWSGKYLTQFTDHGLQPAKYIKDKDCSYYRTIANSRCWDSYYHPNYYYPYIRSDGMDLRIIAHRQSADPNFWSEAASWDTYEIDRIIDRSNAVNTQISFKLPQICPVNLQTAHAYTQYWLYYANPMASTALHDPDNVYLMFDGFEEYTRNADLRSNGGWLQVGTTTGSNFKILEYYKDFDYRVLWDGKKCLYMYGGVKTSPSYVYYSTTLNQHYLNVKVQPIDVNEDMICIGFHNGLNWVKLGMRSGLLEPYNCCYWASSGGTWTTVLPMIYTPFSRYQDVEMTINPNGVSGWVNGQLAFSNCKKFTTADKFSLGAVATSGTLSAVAYFDHVVLKSYVTDPPELALSAPEGTNNWNTARISQIAKLQLEKTRRLRHFGAPYTSLDKTKSIRISDFTDVDKTELKRLADRIFLEYVGTHRLPGLIDLEASTFQRIANRIVSDKFVINRLSQKLAVDKNFAQRMSETTDLDKIACQKLANLMFKDKTVIYRLANRFFSEKSVVACLADYLDVDKTQIQRLSQRLITDKIFVQRLANLTDLEKEVCNRLANIIVKDKTICNRLAQELITDKSFIIRLAHCLDVDKVKIAVLANKLGVDKAFIARIDNLVDLDRVVCERFTHLIDTDKTVTNRLANKLVSEKSFVTRLAFYLDVDKTEVVRLTHKLLSDKIWIADLAQIIKVDKIVRQRVKNIIVLEIEKDSKLANVVVPDKYVLNKLANRLILEEELYLRLANRLSLDAIRSVDLANLIVIEKVDQLRLSYEMITNKIIRTRLAHYLSTDAEEIERLSQLIDTDKILSQRVANILKVDKSNIADLAQVIDTDKATILRLLHISMMDKTDLKRLAQKADLAYEKVIRLVNTLAKEKAFADRLANYIPITPIGTARLSEILKLNKEVLARLPNTSKFEAMAHKRLCQTLRGNKILTEKIASILRFNKEDIHSLALIIVTDKHALETLANELLGDKTLLQRMRNIIKLEETVFERLACWVDLELGGILRIAHILNLESEAIARLSQVIDIEDTETRRLANTIDVDKILISKVANILGFDKVDIEKLAQVIDVDKETLTRILHILVAEATDFKRLAQTAKLEYCNTVRLAHNIIKNKEISQRVANLIPISQYLSTRLANVLDIERIWFERVPGLIVLEAGFSARLANSLRNNKFLTQRLAEILDLDKNNITAIANTIASDKVVFNRVANELLGDKTFIERLTNTVCLEESLLTRLAGWIDLEASSFLRMAGTIDPDKAFLARLAQEVIFESQPDIRMANIFVPEKFSALRLPQTTDLMAELTLRFAHRFIVDKELSRRVSNVLGLESGNLLRLRELIHLEKASFIRLANLLVLSEEELIRISNKIKFEADRLARIANNIGLQEELEARIAHYLGLERIKIERLSQIIPLVGLDLERIANTIVVLITRGVRLAQKLTPEKFQEFRFSNIFKAYKNALLRLRCILLFVPPLYGVEVFDENLYSISVYNNDIVGIGVVEEDLDKITAEKAELMSIFVEDEKLEKMSFDI